MLYNIDLSASIAYSCAHNGNLVTGSELSILYGVSFWGGSS